MPWLWRRFAGACDRQIYGLWPATHLVVLLVSRVRVWRQALLIVQPATLLRWHRRAFRLFWRRTSCAVAPSTKPKVVPETIVLIKEMAAANRLWEPSASVARCSS